MAEQAEQAEQAAKAEKPEVFASDGRYEERPKGQVTPEERLVGAAARRESGNHLFRSGQIKLAIKEYDQVIFMLESEFFEDADEAAVARAAECRVPTQLNLALCYLRLEPPQASRALTLCEEVLYNDPDNPKATYRKGKALVELGELEEAEYELTRAYKFAPDDAAVRGDLEKLRQRMKKMKIDMKKSYEKIFEKGTNFGSDRDKGDSKPAEERNSSSTEYNFMKDPKENPFKEDVDPSKAAHAALDRGEFEEAVWAYEAAIVNSGFKSQAAVHCASWFELGRIFMDMNIDLLALRCLNKAAEVGAESAPSHPARKHALLLRAICLLNEAENDTLAEVSACLNSWLDVSGAGPAPASDDAASALLNRLSAWRDGGGAAADVAIAEGLLHLLHGREEALPAFARSLTSDVDEGSCFGGNSRRSTRWNMLGAVLANRGRAEHAVAAYSHALSLQPYYPRALTNRAMALQGQKDFTGAMAALALALELLPSWASPVLWEMMKKVTEEHSGTDGSFHEAAQLRSLAKLHELLGKPPRNPASELKASPAELLEQIGL